MNQLLVLGRAFFDNRSLMNEKNSCSNCVEHATPKTWDDVCDHTKQIRWKKSSFTLRGNGKRWHSGLPGSTEQNPNARQTTSGVSSSYNLNAPETAWNMLSILLEYFVLWVLSCMNWLTKLRKCLQNNYGWSKGVHKSLARFAVKSGWEKVAYMTQRFINRLSIYDGQLLHQTHGNSAPWKVNTWRWRDDKHSMLVGLCAKPLKPLKHTRNKFLFWTHRNWHETNSLTRKSVNFGGRFLTRTTCGQNWHFGCLSQPWDSPETYNWVFRSSLIAGDQDLYQDKKIFLLRFVLTSII